MIVIFSSVTYALKAQRLLSMHRIYTTLTRSAAVTAVRGCGYGLRLEDEGAVARAVGLLEKEGVPTLGTVWE